MSEIARGTHVTLIGADGSNLATGEYLGRIKSGTRKPTFAYLVHTDAGHHTPSETVFVPEANAARIYSEGRQIA